MDVDERRRESAPGWARAVYMTVWSLYERL